MPILTPTEVHENAGLGTIALAYKQSYEGLLYPKLAPVLPVKKQSDAIPEFNKDYWMRCSAGPRGSGAESAGGGFEMNWDKTYFAGVHAFHVDIPKDVAKNSDIQDLERQVTEFVTWQLMMETELGFVTNYMTDPGSGYGTTWWNKKSGVASSSPSTDEFEQWDRANSTPIDDILDFMLGMKKITGRMPNKMAIPLEVFIALKKNSQIQSQIVYSPTSRAEVSPLVTADMLASLFGLEEVLVGEMSHTESVPGTATMSYDFAYGKNALLIYTPPRPGMLVPTAAYTFEWTDYAKFNPTITKWWEQKNKATRVEGETTWDQKILGADLGVFLADCIA